MGLRCAAILILLLSGGPAESYVLTRTKSQEPVRWSTRCIVFSPDARGDTSPDDIDADGIEAALTQAAATWNSRLSACSPMRIGVVPATRALETASDGRPAIIFRSDVWGRPGKMYDETVIGLTTVWYADRPGDPTDGQISDVDIDLNAVNYTFTNRPETAVARPGTMIADLQNTLTHELGHALGLAHTCWDHVSEVQPFDDTGASIPDCEGAMLPTKITQSTMYPYASERSIAMRMVDDDSLRGVCESYPDDGTQLACYGFIEGTGCALPTTRTGRTSYLIGIAIVCALSLMIGARRRRDSI